MTGTDTGRVTRAEAKDGTGQYVLTLAQAPGTFIVPAGDEGGPLRNGGNSAGRLVGVCFDEWSFQATAGDALSLTLSEAGANTSFVPRIRLHGPDGSNLGDTFGALDRKSVV